MTEFFAVYGPADFGHIGPCQYFKIVGETPDEVMATAKEYASQARAGYYLCNVSTRHGDTQGSVLWVAGYTWDLEKFGAHVNPPASEE